MAIFNMAYLKSSGGGGWQPGANTLLYIPMDTTGGTTDQSSYQRTYTVSGLTHTTFDGVDCYQASSGKINLGTSAVSWLVPTSKKFTANFWAYITNSGSIQVFQGAVQSSYFIGVCDDNGDMFTGGTPNNPGQWYISGTYIKNSWHLYSFVISDGVFYGYMDGTLVGSASGSQVTNYGFGAWHTSIQQSIYIYAGRTGGSALNGYVGEVIMEDIARSDTEMLSYYNQKKGNYGIS